MLIGLGKKVYVGEGLSTNSVVPFLYTFLMVLMLQVDRRLRNFIYISLRILNAPILVF
jgi:hypothetical protein